MGRKARDKKDRPRPLERPETGAEERATPAAAPAVGRRRTVRRALLPPRGLLWCLGLVALAGLAYLSGLDNPFLLDDPINIAKNEVIKRPLSLVGLLTDPRALVTISLRWNYLSGALDVTTYHLLNVLAHGATGCLVFALAWVTLQLPVFAGRYARSGEALAVVIAAVFLLHPIQTESVTYIIQRAEIFVSAGLVGALLAFVAMKDEPRPGAMIALLASCLLGMYSKPSFAVLPALFVAYDLFFLSRGSIADTRRRWPAYALSVAAAVFTFALSRSRGSFESNTAGFDIEGIAPADYLSAQFGVLVHYLRVTLWPNDLCFDCGYQGPWPVLASPLGDSVVVPLAILVTLALASLLASRRQPLLPFALFASAIVLSPTSSFIPLADFYVEHRLYLPIAFLAMALVPVADTAIEKVAAKAGAAPSLLPGLRIGAAAMVCVVLGGLTVARNALLADPIALMEDSLAKAPQNERVHYNLANAYKREGRLDDAIPHYQEAIRLLPNIVRSYMNLGSLYLEQNRVEDALAVYRAGAEAKPEAAMAHRNVSSASLRLALWDDALAAAERSLALEPTNANGLKYRAQALEKLGRTDEAREAYGRAIDAAPNDAELKARLRGLGG